MGTKQAMQKVAGLLDFIKQLKISKPLRKCKLATFYKYPLHTRKRFAPKVVDVDFCPCSSHDSQIPEANQYNTKLED